jgi:hypothetical protein
MECEGVVRPTGHLGKPLTLTRWSRQLIYCPSHFCALTHPPLTTQRPSALNAFCAVELGTSTHRWQSSRIATIRTMRVFLLPDSHPHRPSSSSAQREGGAALVVCPPLSGRQHTQLRPSSRSSFSFSYSESTMIWDTVVPRWTGLAVVDRIGQTTLLGCLLSPLLRPPS